MKGVIIAIGIVLVLVFPIVLRVQTFFDYKKKRVYFSLYLFGAILLLRGIIRIKKKKLEIVIGKFKFEKFFKDAFDGNKTLKLLKNVNLRRFSAILEVGGGEDFASSLLICTTYNVIFSALLSILKCFNPLMQAQNVIHFYEDKKDLKYNLNVSFQFCILIVITALSKKIIRKIIYGKN